MNLRYTDRAKDDVELAFEWYEKQRRGLGFYAIKVFRCWQVMQVVNDNQRHKETNFR